MNGQLVDVPNLFIIVSSRRQCCLYHHAFPQELCAYGVHCRTGCRRRMCSFAAIRARFASRRELNENEFHIDLDEKEFDSLHELWADKGQVEFKLGPANAHVMLGFAPSDDSTAKLLKSKGHVAARYSFLEMRTRCHAASTAAEMPGEWRIYGSLSCPTCDGTNGKTYVFITVDSKTAKKKMKSLRECEATKKKVIAAAVENKKAKGDDAMVADLFCIGDGGLALGGW